MKLLKSRLILSTLLVGLPQAAMADGYTASNRDFYAQVMNIRRAAAGKTLVTVQFTARVPQSGSVTIYANAPDCRKSATLIDGSGDEYGTLRCMDLKNEMSKYDSQGTGMKMEGGSSSVFVYEFSTPLSNLHNSLSNMNLIIPIYYKSCANSEWGHLDDRPYLQRAGYLNIRCEATTTTLSFYNMSAP